MIKKVQSNIKLQIPSGIATPAPPVGPILGQQGINIQKFCKDFNEKTKHLEKGLPIPVVIKIFTDHSFSFIIKTLPTSFLLKKAAGIEKGSSSPKKENVGKINTFKIKEIAKIKLVDMTSINIQTAIKSIIGTALSMGLIVEE